MAPVTRKLDHPNLLRVYEFFQSTSRIIIISEHFKGVPIIRYFQKKQHEYVLNKILFIFQETVKTLNVALRSTSTSRGSCSTTSPSTTCSSMARTSSSADSAACARSR